MYLKELEIVGFKSFAEKTKLSFEPGMTCIVGPNGCGKSNVSDAIRWVLGEQSAKALRGGKMQDVIFNGTDTHKPLSMAEVSLTLADCSGTLDLEYDEVKLTRRVLRSGEGQYYINKSPCRLKDIQRLFMDTGVGTNSYSVLEQGKIDQILSSRPDDRRAIFEEASGITKYKADRKEALRKLDHTEANLLRLDDIIREVKRQIGSLQRQAGKARRYKVLQEELRGLDIFATRERIKHLDEDLRQLGNQISSLEEQDEAATEELENIEKRMEELRGQLESLEQKIAEAMDSTAEAQAANNRNQQAIDINRERIVEFKTLLNRDHEDAEKSKSMLTHHVETRDKLKADGENDQENLKTIQQKYDTEAASQKELEDQVEKTRKELHQLRSHSVDLDSHIARIQNELADMDAREQSNTLKRERLSAEKSQAERSVEQFTKREQAMNQELETLRNSVNETEAGLQTIEQQRQGSRESAQSLEAQLNQVGQKLTGIQTRLEVIEAAEKSAEGYDKGARFLLEENKEQILGSLADMISAESEYSVALQAVLSHSLSALVVRNIDTGIELLNQLVEGNKGAVKLVSADQQTQETGSVPSYATSLRSRVTVSDGAEALADALLSNIWVVDALAPLPEIPPAQVTLVTRDGRVLRGHAGTLELYAQGSLESNPVARRQKQAELEKERDSLTAEQNRIQENLNNLKQDRQTLDERIGQSRHQLQEARRALANKEGEAQMISNESRQVTRRLDTVSFELKELIEKTSGGSEKRQKIVEQMEGLRAELTDVRGQVQTRTEELRHIEERRSEQLNKTGEQRILLSEARQRVQQTEQQLQSQSSRIQELEELIQSRSKGAAQYTERIQALEAKIQYAEEQAEPLAQKITEETDKLAALRDSRLKASQELHTIESDLRNKRQQADSIRSRKNALQIEQTEKSTRRQTAFERLASDYNVSLEDIMQAAEPEWEDGERPDRDSLETRIAELRAKLESLGPVNLVAIEEHQELEERYAFLTQQQQDLVNSKAQLIDMIKKINQTTTELFQTTFDKVNQNFKETFTKLFGGGSAKLVMLDEEDVLETGIEIIARPPGKKLQTVSLLSGGERTMTAVALLFALFMVKPSPFCVLDEMDAALDDANINRFVGMVQEFLTISQFVVITHSRITISAGDVLYGVTMQTRGISKVVSVKMREKGEPELIEENTETPVEA